MWKAVTFDEAAKARICEAADEELRFRLESLLGLPIKVGPFILYSPTVRDVSEMQYAGNALACGGDLGFDDLLHFIWVASRRKSKRFQGRFFKRAGKKLRDPSVVSEVHSFFNAQFHDAPQSGRSSGSDSAGANPEPYAVTLIDVLGDAYGWGVDTVMDMPISTAFQLLQQIIYRNSGCKRKPSSKMTSRAKAIEMKRIVEEQMQNIQQQGQAK